MPVRQNICEAVILFLYAFFCLSRCSNAGYSIFSVIGGLAVIVVIKNKFHFNLYPIIYPIKKFLVYYLIFFISLFLAAILYGDLNVIQSTWKYFLWTLPFWIIFLLQTKKFNPDVFDGALGLSLIVIFLSVVPQINVQNRVIGYFGKPTLLGTELAILVPTMIMISIYKIRQGISLQNTIILLATLLGIYTLLMTKTRGAIIGILIGAVLLTALLYSIRKHNVKKMILIIVVTLIAIGGIGFVTIQSFHRSYDYERVLLLKSSYEMWDDHKLYGVGFGNWAREYPKYIYPSAKEPNLTIPHNVIASFFDETGIIGGFGFLFFIFGTLVVLGRKIQEYPNNIYYQAAFWSFVTLMCHGMVDTGITNRNALQSIFAILGMAFASESVYKTDK